MKAVILLLVTVSMALAPLAQATVVVSAPVAAKESCAMACCGEKKPAKQKDAAPVCRCHTLCVLPAQTPAVLPVVSGVCLPASCPAFSWCLCDESAPERTVRPDVPPPRD